MTQAIDIKICGLKTREAMDAALACGASHVGFIFFPRSPRNIDAAAAAALAERARGRALVTAVTVNAADADLDALVATLDPDCLQLHGRETPERVAALKARYGRRVIKALSVREAADIARADAYRGTADGLLFDAKASADSVLPGGNGVAFDWDLLNRIDTDLDYMLSGGLTAANVGEALRIGRAGGLDVSSGVESAPGVKDPALIRTFFAAVEKARSLNAG